MVGDVACGAGGAGLCAAQQAGATVIGVDPSAAGLPDDKVRIERHPR
jgi:cyclopropane fatty-acyl-phospholipid synthase-like methyltransferase